MPEDMLQRDRDEHFMGRALELAAASVGLASPNPQVGCVLVGLGADGAERVLGEGAHVYEQRDHAEIVALRRAAERGHDVRGATAYVTLEPCSHHGRTGPCADALIAAGIARCVVATVDPNPVVRGGGLAKLQAAGVAVTVGVRQAAARALNRAFAWSIQHGRPMLTLKSALSVDGFLAPPAAHRAVQAEPFWLTGAEARAEVQRLRHGADALLTGIGTVLADDPYLTDRSGLPRRRPLLRVVLDAQLRTPPASRLVQTADGGAGPDLLLLCAETAPAEREAALLAARPRGSLLVRRVRSEEGGRLDLGAALALMAELGCRSVLVEGGATLNAALLREELVDELVLFFAERELGEGSIPFASGGPSPFAVQERLSQLRHAAFGADVMVSGLLHDPWAGIA